MVFRTPLGALEGHLEPLWVHFGIRLGIVGSLEGSWRVPWHLLGGSLGLVGGSRDVLGEVFGAFGGCLVPPLGVHGLF